jgi:hypothetical protein
MAKESIIKIRIINKSKQGVILDMKEQGKKSIPWETFNSMFIIVDNVWATFNEETLKKRERFDDLMSQLCVTVMMNEADEKKGDTSNFLHNMAMIGGITKKLQEEFGFSMMQIMQEARKRIAIIRSPSTWKETPEEYRERHARQAEEKAKREAEERNYRQGTISNATESMANVKGADKLKELFKV